MRNFIVRKVRSEKANYKESLKIKVKKIFNNNKTSFNLFHVILIKWNESKFKKSKYLTQKIEKLFFLCYFTIKTKYIFIFVLKINKLEFKKQQILNNLLILKKSLIIKIPIAIIPF
jgi:hypothetical protein